MIDFTDINTFDFIVLGIIGISTLMAFFKGFIITVLSFLTWIAASLAVFFLYPYGSAFLAETFSNPIVSKMLAVMGIFILSFIFMTILNIRIAYYGIGLFSGGLDKALGFAFGFVRGLVICCIIFFSVNLTYTIIEGSAEAGPEWLKEAKTYNALDMSTNFMIDLLPDTLFANIEDQVGKLKTAIVSGDFLNLDSPSSMPSVLSGDQKNIMKDIINALPENDLANLYSKYSGSSEGLSDLERVQIFEEIIDLFLQGQATGAISQVNAPSAGDINNIQQILQNYQGSMDTGYENYQLEQMNRLVNTVQ